MNSSITIPGEATASRSSDLPIWSRRFSARTLVRHAARWIISGAALSIAQSWCASQLAPTRETTRPVASSSVNQAIAHSIVGPPLQSLTSYAAPGAVASPAGPVPRTCLYSDSYGWPFRSFTLIYARDMTAPGVLSSYRLWAGIPLPAHRPGDAIRLRRALPIVPTPGLAANTALYGALGCLAWTMIVSARIRRRVSRGICQNCGYPMTPDRPCAECGTRNS